MTRPPSDQQPAPDPVRGRHGLRIGRLVGIPIFVGASWPVVALIVIVTFGPSVRHARPDLGAGAYAVAAAYALLLFVSVLVHEAAHALAAKQGGLAVDRMVVDFWGGHTVYDAQGLTPGRAAFVAVVGPLSNLGLAGLGWAGLESTGPGIGHGLFDAFMLANLFVGLFNLLPGLPLDGGHLVQSLVWRVTGSKARGMLAAGYMGMVLVALGIVWTIGRPMLRGEQLETTDAVWTLFIALFLFSGARQAVRYARFESHVDELALGQVARPAAVVRPDTPLAAAAEAVWRLGPRAQLVVVGGQGEAVGLVGRDAMSQVPDTAYAWTPVSAVATRIDSRAVMPNDPSTPMSAVVQQMVRSSTDVVVLTGAAGEVTGVVQGADIGIRAQ